MDNHSVIQNVPGEGKENEAFEMEEPQNNNMGRIIENITPESPNITSVLNDNHTEINGRTDRFPKFSDSIRKKKKVSLSIPELQTDSKLTSNEPEFKELEHDPNDVNILARIIEGIRLSIYNLIVKNKQVWKHVARALVFILYNAYFITAILYNRRHEISWDWCDGHGLLIILTAATYWGLFYFHVLKPYFGKSIYKTAIKPVLHFGSRLFSKWYTRWLAVFAVIGAIVAFIVVDSWDSPKRMVSAAGVVVMVLIGLIFSQHPGRVQWRQVLGGMGVQFALGLLALRWEGGRNFLDCVSSKVTRFLSFSNDGSNFIYGFLSSGSMAADVDINSTTSGILGKGLIYIEPLFAFQALSVIYFFSFIVGLLYHIGVMTWVVMKVGWVLQIALGTTAAESMNASANIFLGQTEAPILIKPFLKDMTKSEIHAVMTGGFATIAGSVMAAYISFGVEASSLLTASVMAAPAALAFSKLVYPETKVSKTMARDIKRMNTRTEGNALDAAAQGAAQGFILIGNIIANLIAVISFVAFLNAVISWLGILVGQEQLSFEWILGKIFIPFAYCLGVDEKDTEDIALLLGLKTVVNEFVAYQRLLAIQDKLTARSKRIAEFALCSFANFSSVGIQLGGLSTLSPERRLDFSKVVWSALVAGTLASFLNACVAGSLLSL